MKRTRKQGLRALFRVRSPHCELHIYAFVPRVGDLMGGGLLVHIYGQCISGLQ